MGDKTFELIEKMYSEMQEGFKSLKYRQLKLEDRLEDTRKTLFDGYK